MPIKVITGCMKSGKSEEIIRRFKRAEISCMKVQLFKPDQDRRFDESSIVSRDRHKEKCIVVPAENAEYILSVLEPGVELVIIDEAQFFAPRIEEIERDGYVFPQTTYPIVHVVQQISDMGAKVVVTGLDMDSNRVPFGPMPYLMAIADEVKKLHAVCEVCHGEAMYSFANFTKKEQVALGDTEYVALCRHCYNELQEDDCHLAKVKEGSNDTGSYKLLYYYEPKENREDEK